MKQGKTRWLLVGVVCLTLWGAGCTTQETRWDSITADAAKLFQHVAGVKFLECPAQSGCLVFNSVENGFQFLLGRTWCLFGHAFGFAHARLHCFQLNGLGCPNLIVDL